MAITCPRCGAGISGLDGALPCPHCETWLFALGGTGIPHRMVTSVRAPAEILKAAADAMHRAGSRARPSAPTYFLIPYLLSRDGPGGSWTGRAAVRLPASCLERIPIYGAETTWFDPRSIPQGFTLLEATLSAPSAGEDEVEGVTELRHVPIAHVAYDDERGSGAIWIDAERGQVLGGTCLSPAARPLPGAPALAGWLGLCAIASAVPALVAPVPWGALGTVPIVLALWRLVHLRIHSDPGRGLREPHS
jgi:hypothetical protein